MTLSAERFAEVRALWEAALEQPAAERDAFVHEATPHDDELRHEVLSLLEAHHDTGGLFSDAYPGGVALDLPLAGESLVGRTLGAYRVVREIGHGGMGTVYEAERADDQFRKRVAIKTLRYGRASADVLARFANERQIQGALAHPNIATLLDAGVTDGHVPFLVLEFVDGEPIDAYCSARQLPLTARLDLFLQVVNAVQHAHRQLVVHRDLKPSNILVTSDGVVKLLDFGISKLIDETPDHLATAGVRAFTTAYASPEQIRGEPVSTATDVYSLGVVLYRLVTGRTPFDTEHTTSAAAFTAICETDPAAPSAVVTAESAAAMGFDSADRLRRALTGELDAIILMALRKEPARRYATADAMGEDVLDHLRGRPVQAQPDSIGYRVRKLVGRNRLATAAVVVAFVAMGAGTSVALWQARVARRALVVAETQTALAVQDRRTAERVSAFLQQMFSAADRSWAGGSPGPNTSIAEVIDAAAERVDRDLADEPAVAEALHRSLESIYTALRDTEKGTVHSRRVLALMKARGAPGVEIARGLHDLGALQFLAGERDSALATLEASYALFEQAGFPETEDFSLTLNQLGLTLWDMGRPLEAEPFLTRALDVRTAVLGNDVVAAIISSNVGLIRDAQGDLAGAEAFHRKAEAIYATLRDREYFEHGYNLNNLAVVLMFRGQLPEAEQTMEQALAVLTRILGPEHVVVGLGRLNLARIALAGGRPDEALTRLRAREGAAACPAPHARRHRAREHVRSGDPAGARSGRRGGGAGSAGAGESHADLRGGRLAHRGNGGRAGAHPPGARRRAGWSRAVDAERRDAGARVRRGSSASARASHGARVGPAGGGWPAEVTGCGA